MIVLDNLNQLTRPEAACWAAMARDDYESLGATRPETRAAVAAPSGEDAKQDLEAALNGLPLRVESLMRRGYGSETWLVRTTAPFQSVAQEQALVAKLATGVTEDPAEFFSALPASDNLAVLAPIYSRHLPNDRLLTISPHLPLGSLRQHMHGAALKNDPVRRIVNQLAAVLSRMSAMKADKVLVHGDIKPENILVKTLDPLDILLGDFDHSLWVPREDTRRHDGMYSLRYAAPEAFSGLWSETSDMWSLGILLLELLLGRHPFDGLSDDRARATLITSWVMPDDAQLDDDWRALLLGTLDRNWVSRWRVADVELWLRGDRATIAKGLSKGRGEKSAPAPFVFNGREVYRASSLARALVTNWDDGIAALRSPALEDWLRDSLASPDLVSRLQDLLKDPSLSDDARLIRFAYFAHPTLEPLRWRDVRLSQSALQQLASQALEGNSDAYQKLVMLRDAGIVDSYSSLGFDGPRELIGDWGAGWERYQSGWQRLREAVAPEARPADEAAFPVLVRLWLSPEARKELVARMQAQSSTVRLPRSGKLASSRAVRRSALPTLTMQSGAINWATSSRTALGAVRA